MSDKSYEVIDEGTAIACMLCGFVSDNREDVRRRHCPNCGVYHDEAAKKQAEEEECQKDISDVSGTKPKGGKGLPPAKCLATKLGQRKYSGHGLKSRNLGSHFTRRRLH